MLVIVRRFALLMTMLFWQGGFMFYGAVVVPVGTDVLESPLMQGWITRSVTNYLNLAGLVAIVVSSWDIAKVREQVRVRWLMWSILVLTLGLLEWLHIRMDALLDLEGFRILDRLQFQALHSWYLITSTVQWAASMALVVFTLLAWRAEDCSGTSQRLTLD